ncbi:hypothetical protein [Labrenzia sp. DG1229]|uniref:hypothetical protein n=1 Tax=Labrenzia sp. DG1229 TaxID=681847 RepID=UPI001AD90797|nr:hypothetical protein [Labrenzia sp. DG1229]
MNSPGRYSKRRVLVKAEYRPSKIQAERISDWIKKRVYQSEPIQIHEDGVAFQIDYSKKPQSEPFVRTSMPPECFSLKKNPIFAALDEKRRQLRGGDPEALKLIILADVGAELLHQIGGYIHRSWSPDQTYGPDIIQSFIQRFRGEIDAVVVVSAWDMRFKGSGLLGVRNEPNIWKITVFVPENNQIDWSNIEYMFSRLPPPRIDANLARQNQRHGNFRPTNRVRYKVAQIFWRKEPYLMQLKFSAGALRDLISGDLKPDDFLDQFPEKFRNVIKHHQSISSIKFEKGKSNDDDDLVVLSFEEDPAVREFE